MTPVGVRDGDPDALAGLCERRGPAVLAYCEVVVGHAQAASAAAEAFGSFRAGVVATDDLANLNPEALLISATRHTAARYAGGEAPQQCARVPALLAARADRSITLADYDWLQEHLPDCWTCRAPVARFEAADRAYRDPPVAPFAPETTAAIVAAMTAAAPVVGAAPAPAVEPVAAPGNELPSPNGDAAQGNDTFTPDHVDQPTAAWQIGVDDVDVDVETEPPAPEPPADAALEQPAERSPRRGPRIAGLASRLRAGRTRAASGRAAPVMAPAAQPRRAGRGSGLARARRIAPASSAPRPDRRKFKPGVVLPIVLVLVAIIVALLIAGVFGGREAASSPESFSPEPSTPAQTTTTPVVVVPGAESGSAQEVERAKARRRAAQRAKTATTGAAPDPSPTPAAASQPATPAAASTPANEPKPSATVNEPSTKAKSEGDTSSTKPKAKADTATAPSENPPPVDEGTAASPLPAPAPPAAPG